MKFAHDRSRRLLLKSAALGGIAGGWPLSLRAEARQTAFRAIPKALWVWLKDEQELPAVARFARAYRFDALMIHFRRPARAALIAQGSPAVNLLRELKSEACACYALAGEAQWLERGGLPRTIEEIVALQRRHVLFDGLHLDVEPQALPQWHSEHGKTRLMGALADLLIRTRAALPANMPLQCALNVKAALLPLEDGGDFIGRIAAHVQEVALMAYRDTPRRQRDAAAAAIARLSDLKLPWRMGVLSNPPKEIGTSYYGMRGDHFELQMQTLWDDLRELPLCRGLIFENYRSLSALLGAIAT